MKLNESTIAEALGVTLIEKRNESEVAGADDSGVRRLQQAWGWSHKRLAWRGAPGRELEQWLVSRGVRLEPEQRALEPELEHRGPLLPSEVSRDVPESSFSWERS